MKLSIKKIKSGLVVCNLMADTDTIPQYRKDYWMRRGLALAGALRECQAMSEDDYQSYCKGIREQAAKPTNCLDTEQTYNYFGSQDAMNVTL